MIGSLECTQDIRKVVEGWYIEIDFYSNISLNDDLESEFKKKLLEILAFRTYRFLDK